MKKQLKELIKSKKLSDEDIMKLINASTAESEEEDIMNESDESADSEEQNQAEEAPAKEKPKTKFSMKEIQKMIAESVAQALKADKDAQLLPAQKPLETGKPVKKTLPKPNVVNYEETFEFSA